jgi:hypothetical protein
VFHTKRKFISQYLSSNSISAPMFHSFIVVRENEEGGGRSANMNAVAEATA